MHCFYYFFSGTCQTNYEVFVIIVTTCFPWHSSSQSLSELSHPNSQLHRGTCVATGEAVQV